MIYTMFHYHFGVSVWFIIRPYYCPSKTLHSTQITNLVHPFKPYDISPFFLIALGIAKGGKNFYCVHITFGNSFP